MNSVTLLLRQVNPAWVQLGRVTSQVFRPTPKDQRRLSVYDGDQITAFESWRHYTGTLGCGSVGVLGVSVGECRSLHLDAKPDPGPFPEHAVIVFGELTNTQVEKTAKQLRGFAVERGWQYRAESVDR